MAIPNPTALHHAGFLVRNLEETAQRLSDALGIGPWNIWTIEPAESRVHGRETPFSFRMALATVGGGTYELITPHTGRSVYEEQLEEHGDGFHHTCLTYPSLKAVREAKTELRRQGREVIQEGGAGDLLDFAYILFPEIGSLVEVLYLDAERLPPPEAVISPRVAGSA
jgi:catechol 2,3-dioxygenase-like lactoylglutathione lyase family enzyme